MPKRALLGLTDEQYFMEDQGGRRVWLKSRAVEGERLCDATKLVIRGEGYTSEQEAAVAGERWRDILSRSLARVHLAADFGDRKPLGTLTLAGEQWLSELHGYPVLGDKPGVTVFVDQPGLRFSALEAEGCMRPTEEQNRRVLTEAARLADSLEGPERLAFDLYSGSFFQPSADSRFLMLAMAIETLLDPQPRSHAAQAHVTAVIASTNANGELTKSEKQSLNGSLTWLLNESIGQAGRRLARTLEPRTYDGKAPATFFARCYDMRSALAHGHVPRPESHEVDHLAALLEVFVSDLLAGSLLGAVPD